MTITLDALASVVEILRFSVFPVVVLLVEPLLVAGDGSCVEGSGRSFVSSSEKNSSSDFEALFVWARMLDDVASGAVGFGVTSHVVCDVGSTSMTD